MQKSDEHVDTLNEFINGHFVPFAQARRMQKIDLYEAYTGMIVLLVLNYLSEAKSELADEDAEEVIITPQDVNRYMRNVFVIVTEAFMMQASSGDVLKHINADEYSKRPKN